MKDVSYEGFYSNDSPFFRLKPPEEINKELFLSNQTPLHLKMENCHDPYNHLRVGAELVWKIKLLSVPTDMLPSMKQTLNQLLGCRNNMERREYDPLVSLLYSTCLI